jgi:hypothetical protein
MPSPLAAKTYRGRVAGIAHPLFPGSGEVQDTDTPREVEATLMVLSCWSNKNGTCSSLNAGCVQRVPIEVSSCYKMTAYQVRHLSLRRTVVDGASGLLLPSESKNIT